MYLYISSRDAIDNPRSRTAGRIRPEKLPAARDFPRNSPSRARTGAREDVFLENTPLERSNGDGRPGGGGDIRLRLKSNPIARAIAEDRNALSECVCCCWPRTDADRA